MVAQGIVRKFKLVYVICLGKLTSGLDLVLEWFAKYTNLFGKGFIEYI